MAAGSESERFAIQVYCFLQVLQLPCLLETRPQANCEVVEGAESRRMTSVSERQRFAMQFYTFL